MEPTTTERYFWWWLALIAGAGLFLRVFVVLHSQSFLIGGDSFAYSIAANLFAQGHLFADPSVRHGPRRTILRRGRFCSASWRSLADIAGSNNSWWRARSGRQRS